MDNIIDDILLKLSKLQSSSLEKPLIYNNLPLVTLETLLVYPNRISLTGIVDFYKNNKFLGIKVDDIDRYISLSRFASGKDKAYCDWCGICNGTLELIKSKLLIDKSMINKLFIPREFYLLVLLHTKYVESKRDLINDEISKYGILTDESRLKLVEFYEFLYAVEFVESRWCPFEYIKKLDFDRHYYYYSSYNIEHLKLVQKILREQGSITCNNCIRVLNDIPEIITSEPSIFEDYMLLIKSFSDLKKSEHMSNPETWNIMIIFVILIVVLSLIIYINKKPKKSNTSVNSNIIQ